ncbi:uncharacterized protein LOC122251382 [Penaeus japonicus]|uniref:uncharacterized protein LOC122251382 n=1 Tax=Penaeus japonicus TaxID=27405 RepID=UPI001C70D337|nr:uncharacterized protein LOC122251382 [Penaeus japonicus]
MFFQPRMYFRRLWSCTVGYQLHDLARRHINRRIIQSRDIRGWSLLPTWMRPRRPWKGIAWSGLGFTWAKCEGLVMEDISQDDAAPLKPLEMNEAAALTHTSLLRQASGVMADASMQLLQRTLRAILDFSSEYRKQLNELISLLEYCTATLRNPVQHDEIWDVLVATRSEMDSLKQQLKDLSILMSYAYAGLENAGMAAFMNGIEFTASSAQQAIDSAKIELENNTMKNEALEQQYNNAYAQYIEASQKIVEEMESAQEDESSDEDEEKKENENEER